MWLYVFLVEALGSNGASPVTPTGTGWGMETPAAHHLGMCQDEQTHTHTHRGIFATATDLCCCDVQLFIYSYRHCIRFLLGPGMSTIQTEGCVRVCAQKKEHATSCIAQTELYVRSLSFMCYLRALALEVNAPTHNNRIGGSSVGVDTFFPSGFPALFVALSAITGRLDLVFLPSTSLRP